ncbi:hypothetical protein OC842_006762 [Tilletia horrida]|uniref:Uncharacterized protein n=1 Tax=Tilletia horrida TaxID=155126 RepID=A0AAN6G7L0_9BASI|nr:hypothetical protein OC842_006762 [Tilletia horrida]
MSAQPYPYASTPASTRRTKQLVQATMCHLATAAVKRAQAKMTGMTCPRPELDLLLTSTDEAVDHHVVLHNSSLANVGPSDWSPHLYSLKNDIPASEQLRLHCSAGVFRHDRRPLTSFTGYSVLHQHRADVMELASLPTFQHRFRLMTRGAFDGLDAKGVYFSGGCVTACLTTDITKADTYQNSDVDIFLCAGSPGKAVAIVQRIQDALRHNIADFDANYRVLRTPGVITLIPSTDYATKGYRKLQIVMALYTTPSDIVTVFDLDPVAVLYDLDDVFIAPRAMRSYWTGCTFVTNAIRSSSAPRILNLEGGVASVGSNKVFDKLDEEKTHVHCCVMDTEDTCVTDRNIYTLASTVRRGGAGQWTYSATDFGRLIALWDLVARRKEREEALIAATKGQTSMYGLYHEPSPLAVCTDSGAYIEAFVGAGFLTEEDAEKRIKCHDSYAENGTRAYSAPRDACAGGSELTLILPTGLSARLQREYGISIKRKKYAANIPDWHGVEFELCTWRQTAATIWCPPQQSEAAPAYRLLKKLAQLTYWLVGKMEYGAPWASLRFSKTFAKLLENDVDSSFPQDAHFRKWLCS